MFRYTNDGRDGIDKSSIESRIRSREELAKNIVTAMSGDTKDIIGAGGPGDIPLESARVGGYCKISKVHYTDATCTTVGWTE